MAYEIDTATDYIDLLDRVRTLALAQGWTALRWTGTELIMRGPGLSGQDEIYIGIRTYADVAGDRYGWELRGYGGFDPAQAYEHQPGASPACYMPLWNAAIPYWLVANGQRIVLAARVSTVYEACYLGLIDRYMTPSQYPYPLYIAGASPSQDRWSSTSADHRHFGDPGPASYLMQVDGTWRQYRNAYNFSGSERRDYARNIWPQVPAIRELLDGGYLLVPLTLIERNDPIYGIYGELDGCYWVSGYGQASENLIQIGGVDHIVVQNVYRAAPEYYTAIRLE